MSDTERNGSSGWSTWRDRLMLAACAAVVALVGLVYGDVRGVQRDLDLRVRTLEAAQAASAATKVDVDRRLGAVEDALRDVNRKLDVLINRREPAPK